jgi:hypothetical protein
VPAVARNHRRRRWLTFKFKLNPESFASRLFYEG